MAALVFAHIGKTAGTSTANALAGLFDTEQVHIHHEAGLPSQVDKLGLIVSHRPFSALEHIDGSKLFVTSLRHPVERLVSLYTFWHSLLPHEAHCAGSREVLEVRGQTFEEFLLSDAPRLRLITDNALTRHFCPPVDTVEESHVQTACDNLKKMSAILFVDRLDEDLRHLFDRLGCLHRFSARRDRVTVPKGDSEKGGQVNLEQLSDQARQALWDRTARDHHLYHYARSLSDELKHQEIELRDDLPLKRGTLSRGERLVPRNTPAFVEFLGDGWAEPHQMQWTEGSPADLLFHVRGGSANGTVKIKLVFAACLMPNRAYVITNVSVDRGSPKTVLFISDGVSLHFNSLPKPQVDLICAPSTSAQLDFELDASLALHQVRFEPLGVSSPSVMAFNVDDRPLAIRFEALEVL